MASNKIVGGRRLRIKTGKEVADQRSRILDQLHDRLIKNNQVTYHNGIPIYTKANKKQTASQKAQAQQDLKRWNTVNTAYANMTKRARSQGVEQGLLHLSNTNFVTNGNVSSKNKGRAAGGAG